MTEPVVPPLLRPVRAREPLKQALDQIEKNTSRAGDLFWADDALQANLAIVLEPEVPASRAREMAPLAMVALGDCLGVLTPPQVGVQFRYPLVVAVNAGTAGKVTVAMSTAKDQNAVPCNLVLHIEISLAHPPDAPDPGLHPELTTLAEEGCAGLSHITFIETYARHFLSWMAIWEDEGFAKIERSWRFRAEDESSPDLDAIARTFIPIGGAP